MAFNAALASRIEKGGDRDVAPYFAGREREMSHFDDALVEVDYKKKQTVFRVFQGAPGCGKTSLLHHLRETRREDQDLLFVEVDSALESRAEVLAHVVDAALARPVRSGSLTESVRDALAKYSVGTVQSLGEIACVKNAGAALRSWQKDTALEDVTVVMTFDEAQNLNRRQVKTLAEMHKIGIGLPSVLLLAGLSHTYDVLSAPNAISRLVANAAMNMGAMTDEECAESTLAMLDELGPTGGAVERRALAERVARVSHSWPQHLNRAQQALCRELGRVNGDLGRVDFARVEHDSDEARAGYYNNRLRDPAFDEVELLVYCL